MVRYFFICLVFLLLGVFIQQWTPSLGDYFYKGRVLVVPLIFFCIAHSQTYTSTLIFAFISGVLWDAQNVQAPFMETITEYEVESVENLKFGYSVFLFGLLGFSIKFVQANFRYYGLGVYLATIFLCFLAYLFLENLFLLFIRGTLMQDHRFLYQILVTALASTIFTPLVLGGLQLSWKTAKIRKKPLIKGLNVFIKKKF